MNTKQKTLNNLRKLILSTPDEIAQMPPGGLIWHVADMAQDLADIGLTAEAYSMLCVLLLAVTDPLTNDSTEVARRLVENINDTLPKENLQ